MWHGFHTAGENTYPHAGTAGGNLEVAYAFTDENVFPRIVKTLTILIAKTGDNAFI